MDLNLERWQTDHERQYYVLDLLQDQPIFCPSLAEYAADMLDWVSQERSAELVLHARSCPRCRPATKLICISLRMLVGIDLGLCPRMAQEWASQRVRCN